MTKTTHTCPRCSGTFARHGLCHDCRTDIALEKAYGITIPSDQWPIEDLAKFRATAAIVEIRGTK